MDFKESKVKSSILVTLTLLLFGIGVIPSLISNWKLISINKEELESSLSESFVTTASGVSSDIASYIRTYRNQIREVLPQFAQELRRLDTTGRESDLPALMNDTNIFKIRLQNLEGKSRYAQRLSFQGETVANIEANGIARSIHGESYISDPHYDAANDIAFIVISEPLREPKGKIMGSLTAVVSLQPMLDLLDEQSSGGEGGKLVYVVDSKGRLLLHPKKNEMTTRRDLSSSRIVSDYVRTRGRVSTVTEFEEIENGKKRRIIGSYSNVADLNWGVIIQIDKDIAFASVNAMIRESMKWGILFALAAALVGLLFARWITNPIKTLAQHALEVGRNQNFDKKIRITTSNEIQQLADTFNYMTDEIKQNILNLKAAAEENKQLFFSSIRMLAAAIDAKDPYTRGHSERVKEYTLVIGRYLGFNPTELERLEIAALLHDVGKIGIEDRILRKPTNLTPEEFEIMKTHPDKGANIMAQVAQLADIIPGMRAHHENYDGSGYPQGLKGEAIPLFGRIITVADTFDAMTTDRPYQKAFTLEFALNRIRTMAGLKYDPKIVEAFGRACEEGKVTLLKPARPRPRQQPLPS